jgi:hypothetical protein
MLERLLINMETWSRQYTTSLEASVCPLPLICLTGIFYTTPAVWMIGRTDKRRVDLPGAAIKTCFLSFKVN